MPPHVHKQLNDSIQLITYMCHQCQQQSYHLSSMSRCSHCSSDFIEELTTSANNTASDSNSDGNSSATKPASKKVNKTSPQKTSDESVEISAEMCSICLEAVTDRSKRLICGHNFHTVCIDPWLKTNITCPMCRKTVAKRAPTPVSAISALSGAVTREQIIEYRIQRTMRPIMVPVMHIAPRPVVMRLSRADIAASNHQRVLRSRSSRR